MAAGRGWSTTHASAASSFGPPPLPFSSPHAFEQYEDSTGCISPGTANCCRAAMKRAPTHLRQVQLGRLWRRHKRHRLAGFHLAPPERHLAPDDCSTQLEPAAGGERGKGKSSVSRRQIAWCMRRRAGRGSPGTAYALCLEVTGMACHLQSAAIQLHAQCAACICGPGWRLSPGCDWHV